MSDDFDLGQDAEENEPDEQAETIEAAADPQLARLQKELKETRRENQTLRSRSNEWLVEKFGQDIVDAIPPEVKAYESRQALAEKIHGLTNPDAQTDQAPEKDSPVEPSPEEKALAAVAKGPSAGQASHGMSQDELRQFAIENPGGYAKLKESGVALERLPGSA